MLPSSSFSEFCVILFFVFHLLSFGLQRSSTSSLYPRTRASNSLKCIESNYSDSFQFSITLLIRTNQTGTLEIHWNQITDRKTSCIRKKNSFTVSMCEYSDMWSPFALIKKKVFDKRNSYPENGFPSAVLNAFIKQMNIYLNKRQAFGSAVRWLSTT